MGEKTQTKSSVAPKLLIEGESGGRQHVIANIISENIVKQVKTNRTYIQELANK